MSATECGQEFGRSGLRAARPLSGPQRTAQCAEQTRTARNLMIQRAMRVPCRTSLR